MNALKFNPKTKVAFIDEVRPGMGFGVGVEVTIHETHADAFRYAVAHGFEVLDVDNAPVSGNA